MQVVYSKNRSVTIIMTNRFYFLIQKEPITYLSTLRKNLCKFKNCDKSDILERLKNNRSNFFTVYNGYCNLSRFFGYQPAGMESG